MLLQKRDSIKLAITKEKNTLKVKAFNNLLMSFYQYLFDIFQF